jgi:hypothetical protein
LPADTWDLDDDGDTTEPLPIDIDGDPRFIDDPATADTGNGTAPIVDMGAYEFFPPIPGDFDSDKDVDASDMTAFEACVSGADVAMAAGCGPEDLDGDGDVDQSDFGIVQRCFTGEDVIGSPACAQ